MGGWEPAELPVDAHATDELRVLHVDDQPDFLDLTSAMLEREDDAFAVTTATTVADARDVLASRDVDCVVSDFDMPSMDGLAFLREVRETHPDLPFVLLTGKGSEEIASRAIDEGVTDYVQKGGDREQFEVLANRIRNAVDQRRAHEALEASRERLARFIEQSPIGVVEWDEDRRLVRMNETAEDVLGYREADLRGSTWEAIVPDHERHPVAETSSRLREGGDATHTVNENVTAEGDVVTCEWHNRVVTDDDGETVGVFSQFRDVTDREEYRRRFRTLVENLPGVVYRCRNEPDWPFEFLDGECERLTGYPTDAIVDGDVGWGSDLIVPDDRDHVWSTVQDALDDHEPFEVTYRLETRSGDRRYIWERGRGVYANDGTLLALEGFITDITRYREREVELEETNAVLSALLENLPAGVLVEDQDRQVLAANPALPSVLGVELDPDAFVGRDCAALAGEVADHFADPEGFVAAVETRLDRRETVHREPLELADGRILERSYVPYETPRGAANLWLYRDVTEEHEHERELVRQNDRLDEFASVVSHDLRNPLNVALGRLEMARAENDDDHLPVVERSLRRMDDLIEDLLTIARTNERALDREPVAIGSVAEACWSNVETGSLDLAVEVSGTVLADRNALKQVLENLFRNTREHADGASTVTVGGLDDGFYVADDGPGIPPDRRDEVLEFGYSTRTEGTGFGLAIVASAADRHGWRLDVTNGPDGGARFEFHGVARE